VVFLEEEGKKALLVMKEGEVREVEFEKEGRMLVRIGVGEKVVGRTARPGGQIARVEDAGSGGKGGVREGEVVFVGGTGGEGVLLRVGREGGGEAVKVETFLRQALMLEEDEEGMDIEDGTSLVLRRRLVRRTRELTLAFCSTRPDLYGPSTSTIKREDASNFGAGSSGPQAGALRIEVCDTLQDHGAILDLAFGMSPPGLDVRSSFFASLSSLFNPLSSFSFPGNQRISTRCSRRSRPHRFVQLLPRSSLLFLLPS